MESQEVITLLSQRELEKMRQAGRIASKLLSDLGQMLRPGLSTLELDDAAVAWMKARGVKSSLLGYHQYPNSICTDVNEGVCHGIPQAAQILKSGDIISITIAVEVHGYHAKVARTFCIVQPSPAAQKLVEVAQACLKAGIAAVNNGGRVGDIGAAVQKCAESNGFSVVKDFGGHGIGLTSVAEPQIPNYGKRGQGKRLRPGMVFTIQPLINQGTEGVEAQIQQWHFVTQDRKLSAQFAQTLAVTIDGVEILTDLPAFAPQAENPSDSSSTKQTDSFNAPSVQNVEQDDSTSPPVVQEQVRNPTTHQPSGYVNPYDVLNITPDTPMAEISKAFMMAVKRKQYPVDKIAKARKQLMNPKDRIIADYFRPLLPQEISEETHKAISEAQRSQRALRQLAELDDLEDAITQANDVSDIDARIGQTLIDFFQQ